MDNWHSPQLMKDGQLALTTVGARWTTGTHQAVTAQIYLMTWKLQKPVIVMILKMMTIIVVNQFAKSTSIHT